MTLTVWYKRNSGNALYLSDGQQNLFPNVLDLYDMSGNASEMCNIDNNGNVYCCGGNYTSHANEVTSTSRRAINPNSMDKTIGFRIVMDKQ